MSILMIMQNIVSALDFIPAFERPLLFQKTSLCRDKMIKIWEFINDRLLKQQQAMGRVHLGK